MKGLAKSIDEYSEAKQMLEASCWTDFLLPSTYDSLPKSTVVDELTN
ncbi:MAG: hypothetical protein ABIK83_01930 [Candidatus Zixiibacteriota bacterium]